MDLTTLFTIIGGFVAVLAVMITFFLNLYSKIDDVKDLLNSKLENFKDVVQEEIKDFHGRLERQDAELKAFIRGSYRKFKKY